MAKTEWVVHLFKKGELDDSNNYRGACLLIVSGRILARIMPCKLTIWAKEIGVLDESQDDIRVVTSSADTPQICMRLYEEA